jgi:hypothetical protein
MRFKSELFYFAKQVKIEEDNLLVLLFSIFAKGLSFLLDLMFLPFEFIFSIKLKDEDEEEDDLRDTYY